MRVGEKKRKKDSQRGSYGNAELKVQREGKSVLVTNVHFLQDSSAKKMQFRDVLQEMHRKKFRGRSKENSRNLPQTEVNPTGHSATRAQHVAVLQADDIYQNVKEERFEMAN